LVQATHSRVDVRAVREMLGIVVDERASKGVIVTTRGFTRKASDLEQKHGCLELIARKDFIILMNQYCGTDWSSKIDRLITQGLREQSTK
jgi:restriction system protein